MIARASIFAASLAFLAIPSADAAPSKADTFDILYLSEARPVVVRMKIATEGQSLHESWARFADALHAKLDADTNGSLDEKELARLRPMLMLLTGQAGRATADLPKSMTRAELGEYLKKNDLGPLRLPPALNPQRMNRGFRRGGQATPELLDKALLELLDANKDGKLSAAEFEAGIAILSKLDVDENELISTEELLRQPQSPFFIQDFDNGMNLPPSPGVELMAIAKKGTDASVARRLLARYGPKPAGVMSDQARVLAARGQYSTAPVESTARRLTKNELKLSDEMFAALDQDGDDELDLEELSRFGQNAMPEVEIALRFGKLASGVKPAEVILGGQSPLKAFAGPRGTDLAIEVPGVRLDFIPAPPMAPPAVGDKPRSRFQANYLTRFRALDRDGNGYLDKAEAANDAVFRDLFSILDKDGDGKLFEKELVAALDELDDIAAAAAAGIVSLELNEAGRGLFGLIDADGDGRFSIRELRAMPKLVERFDANNDGALAPSEVPRRFEATLSQGGNSNRGAFLPQPARFDGMNSRPRPQVGPLWFQKMDRNRDGDVSRREFLGREEDFRKLDADGDGLIGVQEAEAAGKQE